MLQVLRNEHKKTWPRSGCDKFTLKGQKEAANGNRQKIQNSYTVHVKCNGKYVCGCTGEYEQK